MNSLIRNEVLISIRKTISAGLDLVYPQYLYCICCGKIIDETRPYRLCNECMDGMKWTGARICAKCGKPLADINPYDDCFNCREHPHAFNKGYTCTEYGTHERAMVFAMKYDSRSDIAVTIGEIMADRMLAVFTPDDIRSMYNIILPVPVHRSKREKRGYNQAALIAQEFGRRVGLESDDGILVRTRETHVMRSLSPDQRRDNLRGAFSICKSRYHEIEGKHLLLLDDIYTTGATIDEIAGVLKTARAETVDFIAFASGADMIKT